MTNERIKKQYIKAKQNLFSHLTDESGEIEDILTFDLESHEWINFLVLGFYHLEKDHYVYFESMKESIIYMFDYCKKRGLKSIFGHFAGKFDFNFVLHSIYNDFDKDESYTLSRAIPRGSGLLSISIKRFTKNDKEPYELTFHDSSALFPMGLASLASMMKVETQKGTCDFKFIKKAFNNEDYRNELLGATYIDEFGKEVRRHIVYVDEKEISLKIRNRLNLTNSERITYKNIEDGKIHKLYSKTDVLNYLKDDCVSLAQSIKKFYEMPFIKKAKKAKTIAGQAVNVFRTYLPADFDFSIPKSRDIEDDFVRLGYFGGRTEIFKHFFIADYDDNKNEYNFNEDTLKEILKQKGKTLKCFDVNSLYPTCMLGLFPIHCVGKFKGKRNYDKYDFGMWKAKVRVPLNSHIPFLGIQHTFEDGTTKLCFPVGEFTGYWTKTELEYAKEIGYQILDYIEGIVYDTSDFIFKKFIEEMYAMRLQAQRDKDEPTRGIVKLIMNSTYGKLGMRVDDKVFICETNNDEGKIYREIITKKGKVYLEQVKSDTRNIYHKVIIPAYVTAYARVLMHKLMIKCGEENIYYTDTDSIFTTEDIITGDELGELKLEYESKEAVFLLPKTYSIDDILNAVKYSSKITMKGFDSRKIKSFTHSDLVEFKFGEVQSLKAFDPEKFLTPKSAFAKHSFLGMARSQKDEEKRHNELLESLRMDKREALEKGDILLGEKISIMINSENERFAKIKPINYKEIKAKYDKRLPCPDQINTTPIILGMINGQYESDLEKSRKNKPASKYGPIA